ncbi:MFS transporter [Streptomyces sp. NPDC047028]|uniref:MFS transporter n=1 Tax=Streptomyces sp. NPDC047028 TaxID=3155793 RepID=UPI0033DAF6C5
MTELSKRPPGLAPTGKPALPGSVGALLMPTLVFAMLAYTGVQTAVVPLLPMLAREFQVSGSTASWLMTANLLSAAIATPLLGRIGDLRGRRPVLLVSLGGLVAGSLVAVSTDSFALLITARVLQGFAGGVLPLAISVVRDELPTNRVTGGVALISASMGVGSGLGLVAAGVLTNHWSYRSVFWAGLVLGALAMVLVARFVPNKSADDQTQGADPLGTITLAGWLSALLIALSQGHTWGWGSTRTVTLFAVAAVLALVWILIEYRVPHPLVDISMMSRPAVAAANVSGLLIGFGMYGTFMVISDFVQTPERFGYGFSATILHAGIMVLPAAAGSLLAAPLGSIMITRWGPDVPMITGGLLTGLTLLFLAFHHTHQGTIYAACSVFGIGMGLAFAAMPAYISTSVSPAQSGIANGMNAVLRTVGGAIGTSILGSMLASETIKGLPPGLAVPTGNAYKHVFLVAGLICLAVVAVPFVVRVIRPGHRPAHAAARR